METPATNRVASRIAFLMFVASCGAPQPASEIVSEVRGDTTIVTTPAGARVPVITIDDVENGDVWVRTFDLERATRAPWLEAWGMRPERYSWDVFSPEGGLVRTVRLPATFEPRLILDGIVWGFETTPVGDRALARTRR